jgi:hypothetical protein
VIVGGDELRLVWAAVLCAGPVAAGYRLARRFDEPLGAAADGVLIGYLVQYAAVGIAGLIGMLTPGWVSVFCVVVCAGLVIVTRFVRGEETAGGFGRTDSSMSSVGSLRTPSPTLPRRPAVSSTGGGRNGDRWFAGCFLGAVGFVAGLVYAERFQPPLATDAITYHLPAAVTWLQSHRLGIFQVWFFNPANTYSPLAGSMFDLWLLGPMGNDSLARFVQLGPWILIFLCVVRIAIRAGAQTSGAALVGLATVLSRPFIGEATLPMDDLFVAAFFLAAVCALVGRGDDKFGAARLGVAVGLMLAVKYTAVMMLPLLVLGIDGPMRAKWGWRQLGFAVGLAALIAGPWYSRNLFYFHNPVFPLSVNLAGLHLPGLFSSVHVKAFETVGGAWEILSGGYLGLPAGVFVFAGVTWLALLAKSWRRIGTDPCLRIVALGPLVGIALFVLFSPQAEVRFVFPALALMFIPSAILARERWGIANAAAGLVVALGTSFIASNASQVARCAMIGVVVALVGLLVRWAEREVLRLRWPAISMACLAGALLVLCWQWSGYVAEYRDSRLEFWRESYPSHAVVWSFVDEHVPPDATIAYSNQFMVYPLYGFQFTRPVVYAPVRSGASVANLRFPPRLGDGEFFIRSMDAANSPADEAAWMRNLRAAGAQYLLVGVGKGAPEIRWAEGDSGHFRKMFANEQAVVYRIESLD